MGIKLTERNKFLIELALFFTGLWLYIIGILYSRLSYPTVIENFNNIDFFNIIHPFVWISYIILIISVFSFSFNNNRRLVVVNLFLLFLFFWNTATFIEQNARVYDSWWHFSNAESIIRNSNLNQNLTYMEGWTGAFIFGAILKYVSGIDGSVFIYSFPILFTVIAFILLIYIVRFFLADTKYMTFSMIVFLIGAPIQNHFSPQALGFLLFLTSFYCMLKTIKDFNLKNISIFVISTITILITHPISAVFIFGFMFIYIVVGIASFDSSRLRRRNVILFLIAAICLFLIIFMIVDRITENLLINALMQMTSRIGHIFDFDFITANSLISLRVFIHFAFMILVILGIYRLHKGINKEKRREYNSLYSILIISFIWGIFSLLFYQGSFLDRGMLFAYIAIAILCSYAFLPRMRNAEIEPKKYERFAKFVSKKKAPMKYVAVCIIAMFMTLSFYSIYGNEKEVNVPSIEIEGAKFVARGENGPYLCHKTNALIQYYSPEAEVLTVQSWAWTTVTSFEEAFSHPPAYVESVIVTKQLYGSYKPDYEYINIQLGGNRSFNHIYANGFVAIYQRNSS